MPAARQNRSKLAPTSCQAASIPGATIPAGTLSFFTASLSFVDSTPRARRLKAGNAAPLISTFAGTSPRFVRAARDVANDIAANAASLIDYGERFRAGERISSCLAESTVDAVIGKRFAKRRQMQWTKRGAHLLLQTRTRVLDGILRSKFERWYPGLANDNTSASQATAA